jgi:hypothetical protein
MQIQIRLCRYPAKQIVAAISRILWIFNQLLKIRVIRAKGWILPTL